MPNQGSENQIAVDRNVADRKDNLFLPLKNPKLIKDSAFH